jgi:hypothetical protein
LPAKTADLLGALGTLAGLAVIAALFYAVGNAHFAGYALDLGSIDMPRHRTVSFFAMIGVYGAAFAYLSASLIRRLSRRMRRIEIGDTEVLARWFLPLATLTAFAIPWNLRTFVLHGAPLADDDTAYHLSSQILASGRLVAESPPFKLFFDRAFLINDGRFFTQYFLGWPLLMAPGTLLGHPELMNPLYSALTVWPLFRILERIAGVRWARFGVLLWLTSPFLMFGAATLLSHTSCLMALTWGMYFVLRASDEHAPLWVHAAIAFFFGLAFWIRPLSAVGIVAFPVLWWARQQRQTRDALGRRAAYAVFGSVSAVMAAVFLWVNYAQNGSPFSVAYTEALRYAEANRFRFSLWLVPPSLDVPDLGVGHQATPGVAIFRLAFAGFGFPGPLVLALIGAGHRHGMVFAGSAVGFLATMAFTRSAGIDPFGPVHAAELMLPAVVLVVLAGARIESWERRLEDNGQVVMSWTLALALGLVLSSLVLYVPKRVQALEAMGQAVARPFETLRASKIDNAVIFAPRPFIAPCATGIARHYVYWRPISDPGLEDDVIWANHITTELDRGLMEARFPDRKGYVMLWQPKDCQPVFLPLERLGPDFPGGLIGGDPYISDLMLELRRAGVGLEARDKKPDEP